MEKKFSNKSLLPFFIIISILIAILFLTLYLSNDSVLNRNVGYGVKGLELNEALIKVLLKEGETFNRQIQITNNEGYSESVEVIVENLEGLVIIRENSFNLKPGQTKTVDLSFESSSGDLKFEPGVYIGRIRFLSGSKEGFLPLVVELESLETDFDINLDLSVRDRVVILGGTALADLTVYNFRDKKASIVDMTYIVSDFDGNRLISEHEQLIVENQAKVSKSITIPENFDEGKYIFYATVRYGDSVGTSSYIFDVTKGEPGSGLNLDAVCSTTDPLCWVSLTILLILIFFVGAYAYFYLGSFVYNKIKRVENEDKDRNSNILLYFFLIFMVIAFLVLLFYLSGIIDFDRVMDYSNILPGWFLWTVLVLVVFIVLLIFFNYSFKFLDWFGEYKKRRNLLKIEQLNQKLELKKKFGEIDNLSAELDKIKDENAKKTAQREKEDLIRKKELLEKEKKEKEELEKEIKKIEMERAKIELENEKAKLKQKKVEEEKLLRGLDELKNIPKEILKEEAKILGKPKKIVVVEDTLNEEITDAPIVRFVKLLDKCKRYLANDNVHMAESIYEQMNPAYKRLTDDEKKNYYPKLVELQNKIIMQKMDNLKKELNKKY